MSRSTSAWRLIAVTGAATLALAACGGDDGGDAEATGTTAESAAPTETSAPVAEGDGTLTVGTLLPQTGSLAFLGPPEFAGVDLAVKEINEGGGVLGKDVAVFDGDSGDTSTNIAQQTVDRLLGQNVDAIIGAASSGVSLNVIDKITGAGVVHFSPANTSPAFTTYDDGGLYFRTAPSDVLQGRVMADLLVNDGYSSIGLLVLQDSYGEGLAASITEGLESGGASVAEQIVYDPKAASFAAEVSQMKAANPDAIVLVAFDETKKIVPEMVKQGVGPQDVPVYFVDGNLADYSKDFPPGTLEGNKGTLPGAAAGDEFRNRLLEVDPKLTEFSYAPESYDATVLTALAAIAADNDSGTAVASQLAAVSKEGTKCTAFKECADLLANDEDIDYDGVSGPIEFSDAGDPTEATIGIYQYGPENTFTNLEYQSGKV